MNQTGNSKEAHAVSGAGEPDAKTRIIVLGGGFGGASRARHLEKLRARPYSLSSNSPAAPTLARPAFTTGVIARSPATFLKECT